MRTVLLVYLLICMGRDVFACSCKEISLSEYYATHDVVVISYHNYLRSNKIILCPLSSGCNRFPYHSESIVRWA